MNLLNPGLPRYNRGNSYYKRPPVGRRHVVRNNLRRTVLNIHPNVHKITIWWDEIQVDVNVYLVRGRRNAIIDSGPPQLGKDAVASALEVLQTRDFQYIYNIFVRKYIQYAQRTSPTTVHGYGKMSTKSKDLP
jgi:hypothetical protein